MDLPCSHVSGFPPGGTMYSPIAVRLTTMNHSQKVRNKYTNMQQLISISGCKVFTFERNDGLATDLLGDVAGEVAVGDRLLFG